MSDVILTPEEFAHALKVVLEAPGGQASFDNRYRAMQGVRILESHERLRHLAAERLTRVPRRDDGDTILELR